MNHGANLNAVDVKRGMTALMYAARGGYLPLISCLIINGANTSCVDYVSYLNNDYFLK